MNTLKFFLAATALACTGPIPAALAEPGTASQAATPQLTVHVKGMVCDFCAQAVTKVFGKNDAVETVKVDLDAGAILIGLKQGMSLSDEEVEKLVKKSGYALVAIDREAA